MGKRKVIIMGASGRDFHNFNVFFRDSPEYRVVAFTYNQIDTGRRVYPPSLSGKKYPRGIPIYPEDMLEEIAEKHNADCAVLAYSDLSHEDVMQKASRVLSLGLDFMLMGPKSTMLKSKRRVISVCAVRTGAGKSPVTRYVCRVLRKLGVNYVVVRHPMPYGDLKKQACQRFESLKDLERNHCTIEEMEEYEPHLREGSVVYAGVDYGKILRKAEKEAEVIVWDGGNNDLPFFFPDLHIVVADPHRPGHELLYYPGETNLRMADIVVINKVDTASPENIETVSRNVRKINPDAGIVKARCPPKLRDPEMVKGKRALVVEDGPTITHGGMPYGAGYYAARRVAAEIIDPRPYAVGSIKKAFREYSHIGKVLPALGYSRRQMRELEKTINKAKCDVVVAGTPIVLDRHVKLNKPVARVSYEAEPYGNGLREAVKRAVRKKK